MDACVDPVERVHRSTGFSFACKGVSVRWDAKGPPGANQADLRQPCEQSGPLQPQPFTPVSVMPWMNVRWAKKNTTMTGSTTTVLAAISGPNCVLYSLRKNVRPSESV
jgi:hypothetical protein